MSDFTEQGSPIPQQGSQWLSNVRRSAAEEMATLHRDWKERAMPTLKSVEQEAAVRWDQFRNTHGHGDSDSIAPDNTVTAHSLGHGLLSLRQQARYSNSRADQALQRAGLASYGTESGRGGY